MDPAQARDLLARERARIEAALLDAGKPEGDEQAAAFDSGDVAPELLETEIDVGVEASLRDELAAIERAEGRLDEGSYGLSVQSGEPIPDARLQALPWAERTVEEQTRLESGG
ncbi:MAG: TraR/DksA family transcriptional regulator [Solirubrobacterales bacterium]